MLCGADQGAGEYANEVVSEHTTCSRTEPATPICAAERPNPERRMVAALGVAHASQLRLVGAAAWR